MQPARAVSPLGEAIPPLQTCRTQHQTWASSLAQSETEIDQLLDLLAELPSENYRSLGHHTSDYSQALSRLKARIHYLRVDVICAGASCSSSTLPAPCPDPHYVPPATGNTLISTVSAEYNRLKDGCHAFLGELMRLNLI